MLVVDAELCGQSLYSSENYLHLQVAVADIWQLLDTRMSYLNSRIIWHVKVLNKGCNFLYGGLTTLRSEDTQSSAILLVENNTRAMSDSPSQAPDPGLCTRPAVQPQMSSCLVRYGQGQRGSFSGLPT